MSFPSVKYVVRSKKTGRTYLRCLGNNRFDWVMFLEENPSYWPDPTLPVDFCASVGIKPEDIEVVALSEVPTAERT